jgi:hypothetical protein
MGFDQNLYLKYQYITKIFLDDKTNSHDWISNVLLFSLKIEIAYI